MFRTREVLSLIRTTLLSLSLLFIAYFFLSGLHLKAEHAQQAVLRQWARADFDLLSLSRTLRILPLSAFYSDRPMTPVEVRLTKGWMIQGQVAIGDLQKARSLFSPTQREELDLVEKNFHLLNAFLRKSAEQTPPLPLRGERVSTSAFPFVLLLDRNLGMSMAVLSLSIRGSHGEAEEVLARLEMIWERVYGGLLFGFLVILLGLEGWELKKSRGDFHSKEAQLQAVFNAMQDSVIYSDLNRLILFANPAAGKIFGYHPSELIGQSVSILYARLEDFHQTGKLRYHVLAEDDPEPYEIDYLRKDGSRFTGEARGALVRDVTGRVLGFMVTVRDITQRKEMMDRLFLEKEKWYTTLGSIGDAVIVSDSRARVEYLNSIAETLTGWSSKDALGHPVGEVFDIINEFTRKPAENVVEKCLRLGSIVALENHTVLRSRMKEEYAIEDSAAPIRNREGQVIGCVIVFRDVTQKRNLLRQMTYQANYDTLTDLPNRNLFQDRMNQMLLQAHRLSKALTLFYLDLDHFKNINDSAGHPFGDLVLKEVGRRIRMVVRESDTVARLGGDEFAIIAGGEVSDPESAALLARKILDVLVPPFQIDSQELHLSASIGVAFYPGDGGDATTLVRNADIAMYQAKEKGRNNVQFFSPQMNMTLQERTNLENHLHNALEQREFQLLYQPVIDIASGSVVAVEALIRWHHPRQGLVSPARFIPMAEENGLILPLGEWVLETACRQLQDWREQGFSPIRMAVNVSARQLIQGDFSRSVERCLRNTGLPPDSLEMELTESVLLQKTDKVFDVLSELREMGVRLSIDDFGTGYSSLSYLTRFHVNTLKVDGSFVQGIGTHPGNTAVITTILALGRAMSLDVVAEGVETVEQARFLEGHQCHLLQGFLLSPPTSPKDIPGLLSRNFKDDPDILSSR